MDFPEITPPLEEPSSLSETIRLSWPASVTMLNATVMKFVDGLMVSYVSPSAFSAQFMGGMWSFVPESFLMGVLTVVNTFVSQNLGRGQLRRTGEYAWSGLWMAIGAGLLLAPLALIARPFFSLFNHGPRIEALEAMYFRYMILAVPITLASRVMEQFFYGIHKPLLVLYISLAANAANLAANYVLIFGKLGSPALGLEGAAIGTVSAWALQFVLLGGVFLCGPIRRTYATGRPFDTRLSDCRDIVRVGMPAGVQLCNDILCWSLFTAILVGSYFGAAHLAATTVVMRYLGLSFMPAVGVGVAATAMVGKRIGAGDPDGARRRARTALLVAMAYMGFCGVAFYLFRKPMAEFFVHRTPMPGVSSQELAVMADQVSSISQDLLICAAVFQLLDAVGIIYIGALRGAGDTRWPMLVTLALSWTVILGGGWALAELMPQWGSMGPWVAASLYVVLLGLAMGARFESGRWRRIDLLGEDGSPGLGGIPGLPAGATREPAPEATQAAGESSDAKGD